MSEVKPISSKNTDFYQWGKNCAILKFSPKRAERIISDYSNELVPIEKQDMFFEGYYYGLEH